MGIYSDQDPGKWKGINTYFCGYCSNHLNTSHFFSTSRCPIPLPALLAPRARLAPLALCARLAVLAPCVRLAPSAPLARMARLALVLTRLSTSLKS